MSRKLAPCGTRSAAVRHRRNGEQPCRACANAEREYQRIAAAKARGASPHFQPYPCGTAAAAQRHRRNSEELCRSCAAAEREYQRASKQKLRAEARK